MPFLKVLLACVRCPGGELLTHENVLSIFQACFRIGHYQTERSKDMSGSSPLSPSPGGIPLQNSGDSWGQDPSWHLHVCNSVCKQQMEDHFGLITSCLLGAVLLTQASRQDMLEMVAIVVRRLQRSPMQSQHCGVAAPKLLQSPGQDAAARGAHGSQGGQATVENGNAAEPISADGEDSETGKQLRQQIWLRRSCKWHRAI